MQIALIVVVLAALAVSRGGDSLPVADATARLLLAVAGMAAVSLFALGCSKLTARALLADFSRYRLLLRRFENLRRLHLVLWLATSAGIIYWLDWGQLVRFGWGLDGTFLLDDLLILLPVLLPLVLSWSAFWEVDRAVCLGLSGRTASPPKVSSRRQYVALHVRHHLGILLVPMLALLAVQDAVRIFSPRLLESGNETVLLGCLLALLLVLFPLMLRYVWRTHPLPPGPLRERLEKSAQRVGIHARDILVWETDGMVVNAAVSGVFRRFRYIFLTDGLLASLGEDEIEAVFAHEAGHVRHKHLILRMMAMSGPLSLWFLAEQIFPGFCMEIRESFGRFDSGLAAEAALGGLLLLLGMAIYIIAIFGPYSRLLEHQADLFSLRSLPSGGNIYPVKAIGSALEKLAANGAVNRNKRTWQHASIAGRVDFLNRLDLEPNSELHFQQRMVFANCLVVGIVLSPIVSRLLVG